MAIPKQNTEKPIEPVGETAEITASHLYKPRYPIYHIVQRCRCLKLRYRASHLQWPESVCETDDEEKEPFADTAAVAHLVVIHCGLAVAPSHRRRVPCSFLRVHLISGCGARRLALCRREVAFQCRVCACFVRV